MLCSRMKTEGKIGRYPNSSAIRLSSVMILHIAQIESRIVHILISRFLSVLFRNICKRYVPIINRKKRMVKSSMDV